MASKRFIASHWAFRKWLSVVSKCGDVTSQIFTILSCGGWILNDFERFAWGQAKARYITILIPLLRQVIDDIFVIEGLITWGWQAIVGRQIVSILWCLSVAPLWRQRVAFTWRQRVALSRRQRIALSWRQGVALLWRQGVVRLVNITCWVHS